MTVCGGPHPHRGRWATSGRAGRTRSSSTSRCRSGLSSDPTPVGTTLANSLAHRRHGHPALGALLLAAGDAVALPVTARAYLPRRFRTNDAIPRGTTVAVKIAASRHQKGVELSAEETPAIDAKSTAETRIVGQRGESRSISQEARSGLGRASIHPDRAEATAAGTSQSIQSTATPWRIRSGLAPHRDEGGPFAAAIYRSSRVVRDQSLKDSANTTRADDHLPPANPTSGTSHRDRRDLLRARHRRRVVVVDDLQPVQDPVAHEEHNRAGTYLAGVEAALCRCVVHRERSRSSWIGDEQVDASAGTGTATRCEQVRGLHPQLHRAGEVCLQQQL